MNFENYFAVTKSYLKIIDIILDQFPIEPILFRQRYADLSTELADILNHKDLQQLVKVSKKVRRLYSQTSQDLKDQRVIQRAARAKPYRKRLSPTCAYKI